MMFASGDFAVNFFHLRQNAASKKGHNKKKYINHPFTWPKGFRKVSSNHVAKLPLRCAIGHCLSGFAPSTVTSGWLTWLPVIQAIEATAGRKYHWDVTLTSTNKNASQSSQTCWWPKSFDCLSRWGRGFRPFLAQHACMNSSISLTTHAPHVGSEPKPLRWLGTTCCLTPPSRWRASRGSQSVSPASQAWQTASLRERLHMCVCACAQIRHFGKYSRTLNGNLKYERQWWF